MQNCSGYAYSTSPPAIGIDGGEVGSINATDAGVPIVVDPGTISVGLNSLDGYALSLTVQYFGKPSYSLPMAVSDDGLTAVRTTLATDFPIADDVLIQFVAANQAGTRSSPIYSLTIGARL